MKKTLLILLLSLVLFNIRAQDNGSATLTFREAVSIALKNNVTLNQQKNNLYSRQVQKNQSVAALLPAIQIQGYASHTDGNQPNPNGGELLDLSVDNVGANIEAGLTVFNGLNRINTINQTANAFKAQTAFVKRTEQDVIYNVASQYLQVLLDEELLRIAEESFNTQNVVLDQLKEQVRLGARPEADLYTQDAQVRNLELTALRAKVTLENDKALLAQTLQLDPAVPINVEFPALQEGYQLDNLSLDSLYVIALANRQDLRQAEHQTKANSYAYKASISGYLPSVTLFANYGSQYISSLKPDPNFGAFDNQFSRVFPSSSYGVNVTIPLFDRLVTRNNRVINKVAFENSRILEENVEKTIKIDVKRAYNNYQAAVQALAASQVQFKAGELALRTQKESVLLGASNQVALAQANQTYVEAASSKAQAEVTMIFQRILIEYALGTLKADNLQ